MRRGYLMSICRRMPITRQSYFLPTQITGCSLWLDGADPAGNGVVPASGTLATWVDKSRSGNNAIAYTGATAPSYSSTTSNVTFGTNYYYIAGISSAPSTQTLFMVLRRTSSFTNTPYGTSIGSGATWYMNNTNPSFIAWNPYGQNNSSGANLLFYNDVTNIVCGTNTGGTNIMYLNGTGDTTGSTGFNSGGIMTIGTSSSGVNGAPSQNGFIGTISEVIFYSFVLGTSQRQQVEGYLAQKWGATSSLPAGHPGLTSLLFRLQQPFLAKKQYFTAFSPQQISGCILWLDASDASSVTTSGTTVTAITDKSARATVLTSPSGFTYPNNTFNGSYPSFYNTSASGGRLGYNTTYSLGSQNTVFIVGQLTSPSVGNQFFDFIDGYASSSRFFLFSSPNNLNNYVYGTNGSSSGQVNGAITTAQMTSPFFWSVAFDTSTTISSTLQYVNGTQLVQSPSTLGAAISSYTGIIIGQRFTQSSESVVGHICEFIIFNNVLTNAQRQQVESYLAQKWGLVSSLPAGHLNATFPAGSPTAIQAFVPRIRPALTNTIRLAIFSYTGSIQTYTVPAGKTSATIYIWGAAGGGDPYGNSGGAGAFITGIMPVTAGTTYYIVVGGGGRGLFDYPALYVNPGGYGGGATGYYAAGGGGYSGIFSGLTPAQGNTLLLAGGGGGAGPGGYGGSAAWSGTAQAGGGGGVAGSAGQGGTTSAGGAAGTPQTQGIADTTYPGTALAGGNGAQNYGGAGGGGYWGGGGGTYNAGANGGGGGSSYSNPTYLSSVSGAQSSTGSGSTVAPGNTNPYYVSGVGAAGVSGASGGNGLVVIN